jgi:hypothetical protein
VTGDQESATALFIAVAVSVAGAGGGSSIGVAETSLESPLSRVASKDRTT